MSLHQDIPILCDDDFLRFVSIIPAHTADLLISQVQHLPRDFNMLEPKKFDDLREIRVTSPGFNPSDNDILYLAYFNGPDDESIMVPIKAEIFLNIPKIAIPKDVVDIKLGTDGRLIVDVKDFSKIIKKRGSLSFNGVLYGSKLREKDAILKELEEIINDPNSNEKDLQNFLEKYPDLLRGSEYQYILPQACIDSVNRVENKSWQADFVLKPFSQNDFCKIIELKKPQIPIQLRESSGHRRFSNQLYAAIQQIHDYANAFKENFTREKFREKYGFEVIYPDMHIIVGRECHIVDTNSLMEFQKRHNVKIEDWDTFLKKLKVK